MPDTPEVRTENGNDVAQRAKAGMQEEIREAKTGTAEEQARKITALATKLQTEIKDTEESAAKVNIDEKTKGKNEHPKEGDKVIKTLVRAAEAAKEGIPISTKEPAQKLLKNLAEKTGSLTSSSASAIELYLKDYLLGDKDIVFSSANQPKSQFEQALENLKQDDPFAGNLLTGVLVSNSTDFNLSQEQMQQTVGQERPAQEIVKETRNKMVEDYSDQGFERTWNEMYASYALDHNLVGALYSPQKFIQYIRNIKNEIPTGTSSEEINRLVTEKLKGEIGELFAKVYHRIDLQRPDKFFEEIEKEDFYTGIERVSLELRKRLNAIRSYCVENKDDVKSALGGIEFIKDFEVSPTNEVIEVKTGEKDKNGKDKMTQKVHMKIEPLITTRKTDLGDFMLFMDTTIENYIRFRGYTHNVRAIFLHPAGEKGFYAQLGDYAERMKMENFDDMLLLPDSKIFLRAFSLYDKFLDEQFASQDWIHRAGMFSPTSGELLSKFELQVLDQLRNSFKDENGTLTASEDRLRSALAMAVGMSRGVFLNEVEKAAYADPVLNEEGKPTFRSYYTVDDGPLRAFNPIMHFPFRFQLEGSGLSPIYFLPVEGEKLGGFGTWDHQILWKKMQAFKESYLKGRSQLTGEQLFMDFCTNIGDIGGPFKRKGWRTASWFPHLFIYEKSTQPGIVSTKKDYLNSWKNMENVGYEALNFLVNQELSPPETGSPPPPQPDFLMGKAQLSKRMELFKYLFGKYFGKDAGELEAYLGKIRADQTPKVMKDLAEGKISPAESIEERIELMTSKIFLNRTLARIVAQRFPTKFIRIDRDRLNDDGSSRWKKLRQSMGLSPDEFDKTVKNLLLAEDELRKMTSEEMRKQKKAGKELFQQTDIEYRLSDDKLRKLLKGKIEPTGIESSVNLYKKLNETYAQDEKFLNDFGEYIRTGKYKFTFAIEELDMGWVPFREAGPRVLARAVKDISNLEQNLSNTIIQFPELLKTTSINGKGDFSEIVNAIAKAKTSVSGVIGTDYAAQVAHHLAALTINYFKKDTIAKPLYGIFGFGRTNSLAGEIAGRSTAVWEWDSRTIDRFCIALESTDILKKNPYMWTTSKPVYVPNYVKIPFTNKFIKAGTRRKPEISYASSNLRREFGATGWHIAFEAINMFLPVILAFILWQYIRKAAEEGGGKK